VLVEGAFVLGLLMVVLFTSFDLGLAIIRQNALNEAARRLARQAIVHGNSAAPALATWGPSSVNTTAANTTYSSIVGPVLITMPPNQVQLKLDWPDNESRTGKRVRITATYRHEPIMPFVLGSTPIPLSASSTMRIEH
jgi:Flp pilus assembly protein TadG